MGEEVRLEKSKGWFGDDDILLLCYAGIIFGIVLLIIWGCLAYIALMISYPIINEFAVFLLTGVVLLGAGYYGQSYIHRFRPNAVKELKGTPGQWRRFFIAFAFFNIFGWVVAPNIIFLGEHYLFMGAATLIPFIGAVTLILTYILWRYVLK